MVSRSCLGEAWDLRASRILRPSIAGLISGPHRKRSATADPARKGGGILCAGGVLYLWLGHADQYGGQAQLAWSTDRARTWSFADWKFAEFGLIGFVNFGRDYAGARDNYVFRSFSMVFIGRNMRSDVSSISMNPYRS